MLSESLSINFIHFYFFVNFSVFKRSSNSVNTFYSCVGSSASFMHCLLVNAYTSFLLHIVTLRVIAHSDQNVSGTRTRSGGYGRKQFNVKRQANHIDAPNNPIIHSIPSSVFHTGQLLISVDNL